MITNIKEIEGSKANSKLEDTSAAAKGKLLRGYEGTWVKARRNNCCYGFNKLVSMSIAIFFALVTLYGKVMAMNFIKSQDDEAPENNKFVALHMQNIYWFMFIYFCMQGMDELIELFSQINEMEKGALGLFFEFNHFVGMALAFYIGWFVHGTTKPTFDATDKGKAHARDFKLMYGWIMSQYILSIFSFLLSFVVYCLYRGIAHRIDKKTAAGD